MTGIFLAIGREVEEVVVDLENEAEIAIDDIDDDLSASFATSVGYVVIGILECLILLVLGAVSSIVVGTFMSAWLKMYYFFQAVIGWVLFLPVVLFYGEFLILVFGLGVCAGGVVFLVGLACVSVLWELFCCYDSRHITILEYAKKKGYAYTVQEPKMRRAKPKAYADNFAYNRIFPWTH